MKGADECPRCGSADAFLFVIHEEPEHSVCRSCRTEWEPFDPASLATEGDTHGVFMAPCDNCAFRAGSPEREDTDKWSLLMQQIHFGGAVFHCHKGVPVSVEDGKTHDHPVLDDGSHDLARMRPCAGWLATRLATMRSQRRVMLHLAETHPDDLRSDETRNEPGVGW